MDKITLTYEYAGETFEVDVPPSQQIEGSWHRALAHFGIKPADASNLGLFNEGQEVNRNQSFSAAGIGDGSLLRIRPRVQRNGQNR